MSPAHGFRRIAGVSAVVFILVFFGVSPAQAQARVGVQGVYQSELFDGSFGVGARAEVDLPFLMRGLALLGTYDRLFADCSECSVWEAGGGVLLFAGPSFYFGGGAALQRFEVNDGAAGSGSSDDWIYSAIVGLRFPDVPYVTPFLETRFEIGGETTNQRVFSLGVSIGPQPAGPGTGRRGF